MGVCCTPGATLGRRWYSDTPAEDRRRPDAGDGDIKVFSTRGISRKSLPFEKLSGRSGSAARRGAERRDAVDTATFLQPPTVPFQLPRHGAQPAGNLLLLLPPPPPALCSKPFAPFGAESSLSRLRLLPHLQPLLSSTLCTPASGLPSRDHRFPPHPRRG